MLAAFGELSIIASQVIDRRLFLIASGATLALRPGPSEGWVGKLAGIERSLGRGARLGVAALNTANRRVLTHRARAIASPSVQPSRSRWQLPG
jgi:hypothetical protein